LDTVQGLEGYIKIKIICKHIYIDGY